MKDKEFIKLRNKFLLDVLIVLIFIIPIIFILKNKIIGNESKILKTIKKEEKVVLLIKSKNCKKCDKSEKVLKDNKIKYIVLNKDTNIDYEKIIKKIDIKKDNIVSPTIIYIENQKVISFLTNIKTEKELEDFINSYKKFR
ncbi:MAG: hypothetical protein IJ097_00315 [Bacilli bacterium]|nr:hypothetical protein [Bacilli bacterium]